MNYMQEIRFNGICIARQWYIESKMTDKSGDIQAMWLRILEDAIAKYEKDYGPIEYQSE